MTDEKYFIATPNFSNGKDPEVYNAVADAVKKVEGAILFKVDPEAKFNRTCLTIVGDEKAIIESVTAATQKCKELIDMRKHVGTHPRMGAMDVIPLYPFKNTTLEETIELSHKLGEHIFEVTGIPIFYTGKAAATEERKSLPYVRKGQFEGIRDLLKETKDCPERADEYNARKPDLSVNGLLDETAGGIPILPDNELSAAFNVFLDTEDLSIAKKLADTIRGSKGGFKNVTAIGIKFEGRPGTVVSMNVDDLENTPIYRPFEVLKMEAAQYGVRVTGSELVSLVSLDFLINCFIHQLQLEGFKKEHIVETCLF